MKIYTRTGDGGRTGLVGGGRIAKHSPRIEAIGDVDELNASIGLAISAGGDARLLEELTMLQNRLFDLGSELASPDGVSEGMPMLNGSHIAHLEQSIDDLTSALPPLREFILPGGTALASALHLSRCICRRAERRVVELDAIEPLRAEVRQFLNRLSDWLFVAARTANALSHVEDVTWKKSEES